jgi:hypothetical protein
MKTVVDSASHWDHTFAAAIFGLNGRKALALVMPWITHSGNGNYYPLACFVFKNFAPVGHPVGRHRHHFNRPILAPIVPHQIGNGHQKIDNKILVYLPFEVLADSLPLVKPLAGQMEQLSNALVISSLKLGVTMERLNSERVAQFLDRPPGAPAKIPDVARLVAERIESGHWEDVDGLARKACSPSLFRQDVRRIDDGNAVCPAGYV